LREKRERSPNSSITKRKSALKPIMATKIVNLDIKGFHLVKKVPFRCVSTLKLSKKLDLTLEIFFILG